MAKAKKSESRLEEINSKLDKLEKHISERKIEKKEIEKPAEKNLDPKLIEKIKADLELLKEKENTPKVERIPDSELNNLVNLASEKNFEELFFKLKEKNKEQINYIMIEMQKNKKIENNSSFLRMIKESKTKNILLESLKNEIISALESEKEDVVKMMSEMRKKGQNLFFEEMKLSRYSHKIKLFKATEDSKDLNKAKQELKETASKIKPLYNALASEEK